MRARASGAGRAPTVGGAGAGAGSGGVQGSRIVYVINDPYGDQTPRQRAAAFKRQTDRAIDSSAGGDW